MVWQNLKNTLPKSSPHCPKALVTFDLAFFNCPMAKLEQNKTLPCNLLSLYNYFPCYQYISIFTSTIKNLMKMQNSKGKVNEICFPFPQTAKQDTLGN